MCFLLFRLPSGVERLLSSTWASFLNIPATHAVGIEQRGIRQCLEMRQGALSITIYVCSKPPSAYHETDLPIRLFFFCVSLRN